MKQFNVQELAGDSGAHPGELRAYILERDAHIFITHLFPCLNILKLDSRHVIFTLFDMLFIDNRNSVS